MNQLLQLQPRAVTDVSFEKFKLIPPTDTSILRCRALPLVLSLSFGTSIFIVTNAILHVPWSISAGSPGELDQEYDIAD
jgi:hypothetical protein